MSWKAVKEFLKPDVSVFFVLILIDVIIASILLLSGYYCFRTGPIEFRDRIPVPKHVEISSSCKVLFLLLAVSFLPSTLLSTLNANIPVFVDFLISLLYLYFISCLVRYILKKHYKMSIL